MRIRYCFILGCWKDKVKVMDNRGSAMGNYNGNQYNTQCTKQQTHEQLQQKENHEFELKCRDKEITHAQELLNKKLGLIGRIFGVGQNASKNITAAICIMLVIVMCIISCLVYCIDRNLTFIEDVWNKIMPIISLSLGYLFGKK